MNPRALLVLSLSLTLAACEDPRKKQIEQVGTDQAVLQKLTVEAYARIEDAAPRLVVPASSQTLAALKLQVDRVAQACP